MSIQSALDAAQHHAQFFVLPELYVLGLEGRDAGRFLQRTLSQNLASLAPGQGRWAFKADAKGRLEGLLRVRKTSGGYAIDADRHSAEHALQSLVQLVVTDDCQFSDLSFGFTHVLLLGPEAEAALQGLGLPIPPASEGDFCEAGGLSVIREDGYGPSGFLLRIPEAESEAWLAKLKAVVPQSEALEILDWLRLGAGKLCPGLDLKARTLVNEAGLEWMVDFTKGCYVGQEVVTRLKNKTGIQRILVGLAFSERLSPEIQAALAAGQSVEVQNAAGDKAGELRHAVNAPAEAAEAVELAEPAARGTAYLKIAFGAVGEELEVGGLPARVFRAPFGHQA